MKWEETEGRGRIPLEPDREEFSDEVVEEENVLPGKEMTLPGAERSLSLAEL